MLWSVETKAVEAQTSIMTNNKTPLSGLTKKSKLNKSAIFQSWIQCQSNGNEIQQWHQFWAETKRSLRLATSTDNLPPDSLSSDAVRCDCWVCVINVNIMSAMWQKKYLCFNPRSDGSNKDRGRWLMPGPINSPASLHLQWLRELSWLWLISLSSIKQTWPAWPRRRTTPSWGRQRRRGWRPHTPRRNRSLTLSGWGYKCELCHHKGLTLLLCKRSKCSSVFLSRIGQQNVKPPAIVSGQVTDKLCG